MTIEGIVAQATIVIYVTWIAGAASLALIAGRHLYYLRRARPHLGATGHMLLGFVILAVSDAITRSFWLPWHLGRVLEIPGWLAWTDSYSWINLVGSTLIVVGYWVSARAMRLADKDLGVTQSITRAQIQRVQDQIRRPARDTE